MAVNDETVEEPVLARHGTFVVRAHPDTLPANPGPAEAFDDDLAPADWIDTLTWGDPARTGPDSNIVNLVFHSRCAG